MKNMKLCMNKNASLRKQPFLKLKKISVFTELIRPHLGYYAKAKNLRGESP
jgi:hypothetical protein